MRIKIFSLFAVLIVATSLPAIANAQYMTQDIVFIKGGYIPDYTITFDKKDGRANPEKIEALGFAGQGEYNLNFNGFWMGFGVEYQFIRDNDSFRKEIHNSFIMPMASLKLAALGGFYLGAGVSGKYLLATQRVDGMKWKKDIDLWINGIIGYYFPVNEKVFLDVEGRFGWNLTNRQFSRIETASGTIKADPRRAYDIAVYAGIGFRTFGMDY